MAILDIFKKKKKVEKIKEVEVIKQVEKLPEVKIGKKESKPKKQKPPEKVGIKPEAAKPKGKISDIGSGYRILKAPHITEKATDLGEKNQYIFKLWPRANKTEIKKSVEGLYGVDVLSVKIINIPKKKRRLGRISGWRAGYKKAIVKIKKGQKIEVLSR
jgi:large subunit ribosomal protein L23